MPERKVWTTEEDKILRLLREQRGQKKWANIARLMETEFNIPGRTGKQCRERYHNHLDSTIVNTEWTEEEEQILYQMHEEIGNKWSIISQKLPGRSDNCVKNHFYSKLRRSLRRLNKHIQDYFSSEFSPIKESILSKIIKTTDSKFKSSSKIDQELADFCNDIKNRLYRFSFTEEQNVQDLETAKKLINDIHHFDRDFKKGYKGLKFDYDLEGSYLKPPSKLIKKSSSGSWSSEKSEDSFSYQSSNSFISSSDLSDFDQVEECNRLCKTAGALTGTSSGRNSAEITVKSENHEGHTLYREKKEFNNHLHRIEMQENNFMQPQKFERQFDNLVEEQSNYYQGNEQIHYNNMIYDDTPVIARILGPTELQPFCEWFPKQQDSDDIQQKMDKLEL